MIGKLPHLALVHGDAGSRPTQALGTIVSPAIRQNGRIVVNTPTMITDDATTEGASSTVAAECRSCGDEHPLGDRTIVSTTTGCPSCGDTSYRTICTSDRIVKPDDERIADAVCDVDGIGAGTTRNIVRAFDLYVEFAAAAEEQLTTIDGVGRRTAERIIEAR